MTGQRGRLSDLLMEDTEGMEAGSQTLWESSWSRISQANIPGGRVGQGGQQDRVDLGQQRGGAGRIREQGGRIKNSLWRQLKNRKMTPSVCWLIENKIFMKKFHFSTPSVFHKVQGARYL